MGTTNNKEMSDLRYSAKKLNEANSQLRNALDLIQKLDKENQELKKENEMLDDASAYWKESFEGLYNYTAYSIYNNETMDLTDGEVIDKIASKLEILKGESDNLNN